MAQKNRPVGGWWTLAGLAQGLLILTQQCVSVTMGRILSMKLLPFHHLEGLGVHSSPVLQVVDLHNIPRLVLY